MDRDRFITRLTGIQKVTRVSMDISFNVVISLLPTTDSSFCYEKANFFVNLTEWNNNFVYVRGERGFKTYTWLNPCYFFQVISSFEETLTSTLTTVDVTGDLDSIATVDDICCKMNGLNFIFCTLIINSEYIEEWSVVRYLTFLFPWKKPENCCS